MAVEITFELDGIVLLRHRLETARKRVADQRPVLEQIRTEFRDYQKRLFASEGAEGPGGGWAGLSEDYAKWKERRYPGRRLLVRSGALERSLTQANAKGSIGRISRNTLTVGTALATRNGRWNLGSIHHHGRKDGSIPARPLVDVPDTLQQRWQGMLEAHLVEAMKEG